MQVDFKNKNLYELYAEGKSKKYRIPKDVLKRFFMRIQQLEAAGTIYDLWQSRALNFEKLTGYENRFSLRVNVKWRLEMEIEWDNKEKITGKIYITELSKHDGG
ncbi:MAG: type II toxin-antitoxin system RelE/ParE family toxin [Candidatus Aminicenantes bacterium]